MAAAAEAAFASSADGQGRGAIYVHEGGEEGEGGNDRANDGDNDEDDNDDDDDEAAHPERPSDWNVDWTEGDADGWRSRRRTRCHCAAGPRQPYTTPRHHTVYV